MTDKAVNSPKAGAGRHALPTKSGSPLPVALYPNIKSAYPRTCGCRAKWRAKPNRRISTPVRSASLRTTRSVSGFILVSRPSSPWGRFFLPRPSSPGGVSKGEGPQSRPFVPRGGMGDGWRPPCFGWGSKGEGPLRQRPLPLALTWECPPCGSRENIPLGFCREPRPLVGAKKK